MRGRGTVRAAVAFLFATMTVTVSAAGPLVVSPAEIVVPDAFARQQILVETDGRDATRTATYRIADPAVATIDETGFLVPRGAGRTELTVANDGRTVVVPVTVADFATDRRVDFAGEIEPLLSRAGCNAGGCHGKATGQNGFKLSLFGFDPEFDHRAIVSEGRGRRVMVAAPEKSLFLAKATGAVPHGGGRRIEPGSEAYGLILSWIRAGAPRSAPDSPRVARIRIEPAERILAPSAVQQLRVVAEFTDGTRRDVTRQADFSSNLDVVAAVDGRGLVSASDRSGEATIMARYMGQVAVFRAIRPHAAPLESLPEFAPLGEIDRLAAAKWRKLGLRPSPPCDDATFLRRATLDLCGRLPTVEETRRFLGDAGDDRHERLVDRLLVAPDHSAYFAMKWSVILRNSRLAGADQAAYAFHNWIREHLAQNRPYDEFVRGIVAASGEWQDAPAINWYWQSRDDQLHTVTADTAQLFLGIRLQCARCHHHPYEKWGQADYFGLAGFFARLGRKSFGQPPPYFGAPNVTTGERNPLTGKAPEPKFPGGDAVVCGPDEDPRHVLVDWMARPDNPFFARTFANRMWGHFFGVGLVHEVDDMRDTNPPSNPEILAWLADDFARSKFDMRRMTRTIATSRLYRLSSERRPENAQDVRNHARFYARRIPAEVLLDAVDQTCGTKTNFQNMAAGARAIDLPHEGFGSYFLDVFDRPHRVSVCECERSPAATLAQVLLMSNSDEIENKIADGNGRIARLFKEQAKPEAMVEDLYLASFSRFPTEAEKTKALAYLERASDRRRATEDLLWTLLNSREFGFNH